MISTTSFEQLLSEYRKKHLAANTAAREKKEFIEAKIPEIKTIEDQIASISVAQAIAKIKGGAGDPSYQQKIDLLKSKKEQLLLQNGFTPKDLEPSYECALCKDTGYVEDRMCSCLKKKITAVLYDQMNLRDLLEEENFQHFSLDFYSNEIPKGEAESPLSRAVKSRQKAMDYVSGFANSSDNMLITGNAGVGKTFLINCIVKELIDRNYFVIYLASVKFFRLMSDITFKRLDADGSDNAYLANNIYDCDLLVIDDLGTELVNTFVINTLFDCLNERLLKKKHTIISTNLTLDQIRDTYGERISSRITSSFKYIRLLGDDIRIKKLKDGYI